MASRRGRRRRRDGGRGGPAGNAGPPTTAAQVPGAVGRTTGGGPTRAGGGVADNWTWEYARIQFDRVYGHIVAEDQRTALIFAVAGFLIGGVGEILGGLIGGNDVSKGAVWLWTVPLCIGLLCALFGAAYAVALMVSPRLDGMALTVASEREALYEVANYTVRASAVNRKRGDLSKWSMRLVSAGVVFCVIGMIGSLGMESSRRDKRNRPPLPEGGQNGQPLDSVVEPSEEARKSEEVDECGAVEDTSRKDGSRSYRQENPDWDSEPNDAHGPDDEATNIFAAEAESLRDTSLQSTKQPSSVSPEKGGPNGDAEDGAPMI